jgi:hypothetical protein
MKVIVAGSRRITDYPLVHTILDNTAITYRLFVEELVNGLANGVDKLARQWAVFHGIPPKDFPADWNNLTTPGAIIRTNKYGSYNLRAGYDRNEAMAKYVESSGGGVLIAIWDGYSGGTRDMVERAFNHNLFVFSYKSGSENHIAVPLYSI